MMTTYTFPSTLFSHYTIEELRYLCNVLIPILREPEEEWRAISNVQISNPHHSSSSSSLLSPLSRDKVAWQDLVIPIVSIRQAPLPPSFRSTTKSHRGESEKSGFGKGAPLPSSYGSFGHKRHRCRHPPFLPSYYYFLKARGYYLLLHYYYYSRRRFYCSHKSSVHPLLLCVLLRTSTTTPLKWPFTTRARFSVVASLPLLWTGRAIRLPSMSSVVGASQSILAAASLRSY